MVLHRIWPQFGWNQKSVRTTLGTILATIPVSLKELTTSPTRECLQHVRYKSEKTLLCSPRTHYTDSPLELPIDPLLARVVLYHLDTEFFILPLEIIRYRSRYVC